MNLYHHTEDIHNLESPREVVPHLFDLIKPTSVLDVGCGIGTWLKVFDDHGIDDYHGIDGDHVDLSLLKIPVEKFVVANLTDHWEMNRKYDLVLCLEVAEHLPEKKADNLVERLVSHADKIVFSAAIPGQEGQNHLNEQWPEYWQSKFHKFGFYFHDVVRPLIWNNQNIQWWYKQNIFLISKTPSTIHHVLSAVHPELFTERMNLLSNILEGKIGIKNSTDILIKSIKRKVRQIR